MLAVVVAGLLVLVGLGGWLPGRRSRRSATSVGDVGVSHIGVSRDGNAFWGGWI